MSEVTQQQKGERFRALHEEAMKTGKAFVFPNPWDGGSARILQGLGYQALVMHHRKRHETVVILINTSRYDDIPAQIFRKLARILAR